jgi:hypothetical protein
MPAMSRFESVFCRGVGWRAFAGRVALPLALQGDRLEGEVLEIGGGSGAMAARLLATHPTRRITVTDYDEVMVAAARTRLAPFADRASCNKPTPRGCRRCPQWEHPRGDGSAHPGGPAGRAVDEYAAGHCVAVPVLAAWHVRGAFPPPGGHRRGCRIGAGHRPGVGVISNSSWWMNHSAIHLMVVASSMACIDSPGSKGRARHRRTHGAGRSGARSSRPRHCHASPPGVSGSRRVPGPKGKAQPRSGPLSLHDGEVRSLRWGGGGGAVDGGGDESEDVVVEFGGGDV